MRKTGIGLGLVLGAAVVAGVYYIKNHNKNVCMIGHKGYSGMYPENTEKAFVMAGLNGFGGAETDVRITSDGVFVCNHNSSVKFIDGGELEIENATYEQLSAQPLLNNITDDEVYICTFRRYLEVCKEYNMICFIELKGEFTEKQITDCFNLAAEIYDHSKCILQSFDFNNLVRAHEKFPNLKIMLTWGKDRGDYSKCFDYNFDIDSSYWSLTPKLISDFHKRGLKVACWTVNSKPVLYRCRLLGVDYIESDFFGKSN